MGIDANTLGKYQLRRTVGVGTFAKVKLAMNTETGHNVAIKIIDKQTVLSHKLTEQFTHKFNFSSIKVISEISSMKLLKHPNIVTIYEVIATKTKIYMVMEYVSGGQLLDRMSHCKGLNELEARKIFQQLIDAVEYCHAKGVYHRDLKPENLLLDGNGNLKISDFGLSAFRKPGDLLSTACGSPSYVAPEVIANMKYEGSPADVWSCGVILFELLAGYLPFKDQNLMNLYRKISRGEFKFPIWFTTQQQKLILGILDPAPRRRMTISQIIENEWFHSDYEPTPGLSTEEYASLENVGELNSIEEKTVEKEENQPPNYINAFELIALSYDLDLSGLFIEQKKERRTILGSEHSIHETIKKIEVAAKDAYLSVKIMKHPKVKLHGTRTTKRGRLHCILSAEVIEVTPSHCMVEILKSTGELEAYKQFCRSLSNLLMKKPGASFTIEEPRRVRDGDKFHTTKEASFPTKEPTRKR